MEAGARRLSKGDRTRQAILDAAMALYAEDGFRGTGLTAIGERAGITHSAVLYHFGSSRGLLAEVLKERDRQHDADYAQAFAASPRERLAALPVHAEHTEARPGLAKLFTVLAAEHLDPDDEAHGYFLRRGRRLRKFWAEVIREGQRCGELRQDVDPELKALELQAFMEGAQLLRFQDPRRVDLPALYRQYADALVRDLSVEAGRPAAPRSTARSGKHKPRTQRGKTR